MTAHESIKIFVSSTFLDLREHRARAIEQLRKAGYTVDPMENWPADGDGPAVVSVDRIQGCQLLILLVAWRRGTVPDGQRRSITQQEYDWAVANGIDVLPFVLDDDAEWKRKFDESHSDPEVVAWRAHLRQAHISDTFGTRAESLDILPAVSRWRDKKRGCSSPASIAAYRARLAEATAHLTLLGMGRSLQIELPISEAYVPLRATLARSMEERGMERFHENHAEVELNVELGEVFQRATELHQRGVILLGEPGSGKTTGAKQLAWRLASGQSRPEDLGLPAGITPVLLRFRNLRGEALAAKSGLRQFLADETQCHEAPDGLQSPGDDLWNGKAGGLLWILDGLDEVVDPDTRVKVSGWIKKAVANRTQDRFLVTCRFAGYYRPGVPLGEKFVEFHVRPLADEQVARFVRDWFTAAYGKLLRPRDQAEERATKLLEILDRPAYQAGHIRELATNPLLLTILCIVFHDEQALPTNRAELYAQCIRVLLQHWRRELYETDRGLAPPVYDAEAAQAVLARVAWWLHGEQDRTAAPMNELADEATKGLAEIAAGSGLGLDGRAFLERMRDEAGIIAGEGDGRYGFLHLSFQEYLAADYAAREGKAAELASRATQSWWREVALLSLRRSRPFCEAFFRQMLAAGIAEEHAELADRCLTEALFFSAKPFLEVLEKKNIRRRRIAAVLRLLRDRADQIPELPAIARRLAESGTDDQRDFAREILAKLGIELPRAAGERRVFVEPRTGMTFLEIPAGEFLMGSEHGDSDERPIHPVRISRTFWLAKYPVTNAQYAVFLKAVGDKAEKPAYWDDRRFHQPEQPVVGVSWHDAQAFCQWLNDDILARGASKEIKGVSDANADPLLAPRARVNEDTHPTFRLPTEAEWEYACRAGTITAYSFGDDEKMLGEYAWFHENSGGQTQPVGTKLPNPWGLHALHGNVWEWCQDWKAAYPTGPVVDPEGPKSGRVRVLRGGSWSDGRRNCRAAFRGYYGPVVRSDNFGFRLART